MGMNNRTPPSGRKQVALRAHAGGAAPSRPQALFPDPDETTGFLEVSALRGSRGGLTPARGPCAACARLSKDDASATRLRAEVASAQCMLKAGLYTDLLQDVEAAEAAAAPEPRGGPLGGGGGGGASQRPWRRGDLWWLLAVPALVLVLLFARVRAVHRCCT